MPIARFQMPDGRIARFEVPDGTTPDQAQNMMQSYISAERSNKPSEEDIAAANPTADSSGVGNTIAGIGKAFTDLGLGVKQRIVNAGASIGLQDQSDVQKVLDEVAEKRALDAALEHTTGGKVGGFIGNAVPAVVAGMVPGGQGLAGAIATGGVLGAAQPTLQDESVLNNAALGMAGGAAGYGVAKAVPAVYGALKSAVDPFYAGGRQEIIGGALNRAAGSSEDAAAVMKSLAAHQDGVPGSALTAGQASENAGIAALERTASQTDPALTNAFAERMASQNTARAAALQDIAGADGAREFFDAARTQAAQDLYQKAFTEPIPKSTILKITPQIKELMSRPSIQNAMKDAKMLAQESGIELSDKTSIQGLHFTKMALDDQISAAVSSGNKNLTRVLMGTREKLDAVMDKLSPSYAEARSTFAEMSKPINQMDVAQTILDKSTNALTGNLQPVAFAKSLSDATASKATGFKAATLAGTMTPEQLLAMNAVKEDLAKAVFAQNAGRSGSDTVQKLAYSNMLDQAGVPALVKNFGPAQVAGNVAARVAQTAYGQANKDISQQLAETLLSPTNTAKAMQAAIDAQTTGVRGLLNAGASAAPQIGNLAATLAVVNRQRQEENMAALRARIERSRAQKIANIGSAKTVDQAIQAAQSTMSD